LKDKYKEAFDIEATTLIDLAAVRGKWIDQSQSLNIFIKGVSGRKLDDAYMHAWTKGLKTTYYMRGMAATQIEKSTLDAQKYGFTQKRDNENIKTEDIVVQDDSIKISSIAVKPAITVPEVKEKPKLCLIEDPDCEACQ